jgi:hypothetical protein
MFGRNRESRSREAAGRRNWPKPCPGKCAEEKGYSPNSVWISVEEGRRETRGLSYRRILGTLIHRQIDTKDGRFG